MSFPERRVRALVAVSVCLFVGIARGASKYDGVFGSPAVPASFTAATATHSKQFIDFDNDGFVLVPHAFTPIPTNKYISQGVTLLNLDARSVGTLPWAHSPPIGAWHTAFSAPITTPYSFVFTTPVASFGLFTNDVEAPIFVTVYRAAGNQSFTIPVVTPNDAANMTQFHGFAATSNEIQRIDFLSGDYHIIDDVQFGFVPEPGTGVALICGAAALAQRRRRFGSPGIERTM